MESGYRKKLIYIILPSRRAATVGSAGILIQFNGLQLFKTDINLKDQCQMSLLEAIIKQEPDYHTIVGLSDAPGRRRWYPRLMGAVFVTLRGRAELPRERLDTPR